MKGYVRKRGKTWSYTVDIGRDPVTNKRKQKTKSGFKTKKEAEKALTEVNYEIEKGIWLEPSDITFNEIAEKWFSTHKRNLKETTAESYENLLNKHIYPYFKNVKIQNLKPIHGQSFVDKLLENLKPTSVEKILLLVKMTLDYAVNLEIIFKSPFKKISMPRKKTNKDKRTWTFEELNRFNKVAKETDVFYHNLFAFAGFTGMRKSEILGIKRMDIDFKNAKLSVKQSVEETKEHGLRLSRLKTPSAYRIVALDAHCISILKNQIDRNNEYKDLFEERYNDYGLIFCKENGDLIRPTNVNKKFRQLIKLAKVPYIRIHDLRHTHATLLMELNTNPKIVADRLGHASVQVTLDTYSHSSLSMQSNVVELFAKKINS